MSRVARIVLPDVPHHVTQRGNNKQNVFLTEVDFQTYLRFLKDESARRGLKIVGYCLMSNHVHLIVVPTTIESLAKGIGRTHYRYSIYFNGINDRTGHLWQGRFRSFALDDVHFVYALRYAERNPVVAGLVEKAWMYPWSSAAAHVGESYRSELLDLEWWETIFDADTDAWREFLLQEIPEPVRDAFKHHSETGFPLGSERFLEKLESRTNRTIRPGPRGRPRKK